jgi:hypothetical protein
MSLTVSLAPDKSDWFCHASFRRFVALRPGVRSKSSDGSAPCAQANGLV